METWGATHNRLDFREDWGELKDMDSTAHTAPKVVLRLSHLGDVTLTTGVLSHWHATRGDTFIFITRAGNAPLLENHPAVAEVIPLADDVLKGGAWFREARRLAKTFAGHDLIDLHGTLRSRILSLLWRGTVRRYPKFGLTRRLFDRTGAQRFRHTLEATNVPQRYAMALEKEAPQTQVLIPRIHLTAAEQQAAITRIRPKQSDRPLLALHPYATHPAKQWPREHWLALTALLTSQGMDWFVVGRDKTPLFANHECDFTNATDLRQTCALIKSADLLVTADSGPMHLGTAVGTPVAAFFGPTAKAWGFYPSGPKDRVLELDLDCRPCSLHGAKSCEKGYECLSGLTPKTVMKTLGNMLKSESA